MKRYNIVVVPRAKKQIDALPKNIKEKMSDVLLSVLAEDPFAGKALRAELKGLYSYRVGDYRIIYSVIREKLIIQIVKVMHRREVYR